MHPTDPNDTIQTEQPKEATEVAKTKTAKAKKERKPKEPKAPKTPKEPKAKKTGKAKTIEREPRVEVPEPSESDDAKGVQTLAKVSRRYCRAITKAGKTEATVSSYANDLQVAQNELGADTDIKTLTERKIKNFEDCDAVCKLRSGKGRAKPTIDKARRVLRLALFWAEAEGLIERAPYEHKADKDAAKADAK